MIYKKAGKDRKRRRLRNVKQWKRKGAASLLAGCLLLTLAGGTTGCNIEMTEEAEQKESTTEESVAESNHPIEDKKTLYENQDRDSVVTMYLTVSTGNASDNTNHTWEEVNSYSAYDYKEMGVERYAVNGLLQVGDEDGPVEGELGYGQVVPNATVTIRGQTSTRNSQKNYKIELQDNKGTWNDQRVINLNKHQGDALRFTNKLCYDLMSELPDMISAQTQFVHLYVKDETEGGTGDFEDYGLYTQVEQINKSYLKRHGLDKNGQLYKVNFFEFHRYEDIIMLKSDADYEEEAFEELLEIKGDDDHSKLIAMLEDVNDTSIPIEEVVAKWFEEENLFSWLAFHILMGNVDTQSRNVMLYSPLNVDTWYFISWDCDAAFSDSRKIVSGNEAEMAGWENGVSNYWGNVLFCRILKSESMRAKLDEKIQEYRGILTEEKIAPMVETYRSVAEEYAYEYPDVVYEPYTREEYDELCNLILTEVERNYQHYLDTLEEPMPFFIGVPESDGTSTEFVWENAYDFNEETVLYTFELAKDYSFEEPIVKEEGLFTPEYTYDGKLEPGQYFIRVKAVNESGYEQYAFDYYVSDGSYKNYGIKCFYVLSDGSIEEETYEE